MEPELFNALHRNIKYTLELLKEFEMNGDYVQHDKVADVVAPEDDVQFLSADEDDNHPVVSASPHPEPALTSQFRPQVVYGSAFSKHVPEATAVRNRSSSPRPIMEPSSPSRFADANERNPIVTISNLPGSNRQRWTDAQTQDLKDGYTIHGPQWLKIQREFPSLRPFTNVQLKDKYRHISGRRTSV